MRPLARALLLTAACTTSVACGDTSEPVDDVATDATGPASAEALAVEPDIPWDAATLSADGRTLTFRVGSRPAGTGPCEQRITHDVVEADDRVTVAFEDTSPPTATEEDIACTEALVPQTIEVDLDAPLGDRPVHDGIRDAPRTVFREAELVEVTYVPEGFGPPDAAPGEGDADDGWWQQTFEPDGHDWYFAVNQSTVPAAGDLEGDVTPVAVGDVEGERITGQMNDTMETIRFRLGDVTVRVWGEMQGPPTFTHSAELLRIAEGIRLPDG